MTDPNSQPPRHWIQILNQITNMTTSIAGSIFLCSWLGYRLGKRFGHMTGFILLGFSIGVTVAAISLWRFMQKTKDL